MARVEFEVSKQADMGRRHLPNSHNLHSNKDVCFARD